jgi:hypothetical protein
MDVPSPPGTAARAAGPEPATPDPAVHETTLISQIEALFPGWGAWRSGTLRWWAFRTSASPLTIEQLRAGCRLIVQADTPAELCAAIRAEDESARRLRPMARLDPRPGPAPT